MNEKIIKIKNRIIGEGYPAYIIAEMSANHAGSIERAKEIIHAAKEAGADCIKIQTYTPDTMTINCDNEYFKLGKGLWEGDNFYSLYQKAYTPWEWQKELKEEAEKIGIDFFSTPFDKTSVDFLEDIGVDFYKVASFELVDIPLIEYIASKGKPIIISTGMGTVEEIQEVANVIKKYSNVQYAFLKCSSAYPAISSEMNLATIVDMKNRFDVPIGLSDHSMGSIGAVTAIALGACIIEKHFCISRDIENADSAFSMNVDEFKQMVKDIRDSEKARGVVSYGVSMQEKDSLAYRRSIFVVKDINKGEVFDENNIRVIRPGYGLKPKYYNDILGKKAIVDVKRGVPLSYDMVEEHSLCIRPIDVKDMDLLYEWVNDPLCRINYFNTSVVTYSEHQEWFKKIINDANTKIFIANVGSKNVGQIRLSLSETNIEVSYSVAEEYRGMGYGTRLLALAEKWIKDNNFGEIRVVGKVKKHNYSSCKCFNMNGYDMLEKEEYIEFFKVLK